MIADRINEILSKFDINGHDKDGGTDKNTNHSYGEVYGNLLEPYIDKKGTLLEIGVQYGGSSLLWQELLPQFNLCLVDNEDKMHDKIKSNLKADRVNYLIRDAYDQNTWRDIKALYPEGFDIIIDDGPHTIESQAKCIEMYFSLLKPNGCLIIEDISNFDDIQKLVDKVPRQKDVEAEIIDLREVKNRYDDVVFVIKRKPVETNNKIAVFYHVGQMGQWQRLYQEQINSLCISGLYNAADFIHIGVNGDDPLPSTLPKMKIKYNEDKVLEADTLKAMWEFSKNNPDYRVMYFHTKGATQESSPHRYNVDAWRLYLEYYNIHEWEKCIAHLKEHDCVGTEWIHESGLVNQDTGETIWQDTGHYAGNFWWANSSYIAKLDPNYLYDNTYGWARWRSEIWIGTGSPKRYNFYNTNDFCKYTMRAYSPDQYVIEKPFIEPIEPPKVNSMLKNKKAKFVMISMFKNEATTIGRMLESCYKYIDYYILQDNGSTDGTPEVVAEFFKDKNIPGFVYKCEEGWVGFGWNRDHLLQKCQSTDHGCDWIMKMDCDETLSVDDDFDWSVFDDKNLHGYHVTAQTGNTFYHRAWIWNAKLQWKFNHDTAHETIILLNDGIGENFRRYPLPKTFKHISHDDGQSWGVKTKYFSDALILEEKMIREDTLLTDRYHFWYIGKSYNDCYHGDFYPLGRAHSEELARRCIFYFQQYVNFTHNYDKTGKADRIDEMAYFAVMLIGSAYNYLGDLPNAIKYLNAAGEFCPRRNEHLVRLAETYSQHGLWQEVLDTINVALQPERVNPFPDFSFLINNNCYYDTGDYVTSIRRQALEHLAPPPVQQSKYNFGVNL